MGPLDIANHLLNFVTPGCRVAFCWCFGRLVGSRSTSAMSVWRRGAILFAGGVAVLAALAVLSGARRQDAHHAALVVARATPASGCWCGGRPEAFQQPSRVFFEGLRGCSGGSARCLIAFASSPRWPPWPASTGSGASPHPTKSWRQPYEAAAYLHHPAAGLPWAAAVHAQAFPSKPVRIVVGFRRRAAGPACALAVRQAADRAGPGW